MASTAQFLPWLFILGTFALARQVDDEVSYHLVVRFSDPVLTRISLTVPFVLR